MTRPAATTSVSADLDLTFAIEMLSDRDRAIWMTALLETIQADGTIADLRALVNDPK